MNTSNTLSVGITIAALLLIASLPSLAQHNHSEYDRTMPLSNESSMPAVSIDPVVVQNMGVRVGLITKGSIERKIRALGVVGIADDRVSTINLRFSGWVDTIHVDQTGQQVKKGDPLFEAYSPDLISAQEEFLISLTKAPKNQILIDSAIERLIYFGLSKTDIHAIEKRKKAFRTITLRAPQSGYVLHKNIVEGAYIQPGKDLYQIGDLSHIWVNAEVYEYDAPLVNIGAHASVSLSFAKSENLHGRVAYIYPTLNQKTRTLTVRLEFENFEQKLKPGMFATVQIDGKQRDNVLKIPTEAIIHSGERQIVFVTKGYGNYEPRDVVTGMIGSNHETEVIKGLSLGEEVVVSGQFLLDSESQLQEAVQKLLRAKLQERKSGTKKGVSTNQIEYWTCPMHPQIVQDKAGQCPICGMDLVLNKSKEKRESTPDSESKPHDSMNYWTCPMHPQIVQHEAGDCPICGMDLIEKTAPGSKERK